MTQIRSDKPRLRLHLPDSDERKIYERFPHGMCTTHADVVNPDLLAFVKG